MTQARDRLIHEVDSLRQLRDELRLKLELGKAEVRDRWERLEKDWQHLEGRARVLARAAGEESENVGEAVELLVEQLKAGYRHLRQLL